MQGRFEPGKGVCGHFVERLWANAPAFSLRGGGTHGSQLRQPKGEAKCVVLHVGRFRATPKHPGDDQRPHGNAQTPGVCEGAAGKADLRRR